MASSFIPNTFDCFSDGTENFFHSASYTNSSFTAAWVTRTTPYVEGFNTPVYQLVFDKFGVPMNFDNGTPTGGSLPGINIKRMSAIEAVRLSLAESLIVGEWWDVVEDGLGGVYFQNVLGASQKTIALDIRLCIPTSTKTNLVDMVVVKGYDPPPVVEVKPFKDVVPAGTGQINPESITGTEPLFTVSPGHLLNDTRHGSLAYNTVYKSYPDPVITNISFKGQEPNPFYDIKAFEQILGYVVDVDGMPEDQAEAANVTYSFSPTTKWYQKIDFPTFTQKTDYPYTGPASYTAVSYYETEITKSSPLYSDRYGSPWPLYDKPLDIVFKGNKINGIEQLAIPSLVPYYNVAMGPLKEFVSMATGSNWTWTSTDARKYDFQIYFQPSALWEAALPVLSDGGGRYRLTYAANATVADGAFSAWQSNLIGLGGGLGYSADAMYIGWEVNRPSVVIVDSGGDALSYANSLRVRYAPIIRTDLPAPVAYVHSSGESKILDFTIGLVDTDPTTCQNLEETDMEAMEELSQGNVINTTLPFCATGDECLAVAETLFEYMDHSSVQTYTVTCGPDSNPELGALVEGFPGDVRIDSINYSFQDGSSYTIEVSLAPIFASIGQWSVNSALLAVEDVSREAIVRWSAGDGTNYRVDVQGLGSFYAVNGSQAGNRIYYPGDRVGVTVYNIPKEKP